MTESAKESIKQAEAQAKEASKNNASLMKTMGGVAVLVAGVGMFIHSVPKKRYADMIPDKPLPSAAKPVVAAAAKPKPAVPAAAKAVAGAKPAQSRAQATVASAPSGDAPLSADPVEDWRDTCSAEIGILCNNVPERHLPRCLHQYDDALRKDCAKALETRAGAERAEAADL